MNCDVARALIDGGARADNNPDLAEHLRGCAECLREYDAESILVAAELSERIRPRRQLAQALLDVPKRERRLHVLAPAMVPLAGVACGIGALVVALALRGQGSWVTLRVATPVPHTTTAGDDRPSRVTDAPFGSASAITPGVQGVTTRAALATATGTPRPAPTLLALGPRVPDHLDGGPGHVSGPTPTGPHDSLAPSTPPPTVPPGDESGPVPAGTPTSPAGAAPGPPPPTPTDPSRITPPTSAPGPPQPTLTPGANFPPPGPMPTASQAPSATQAPPSTPTPTQTPSPSPTHTPSPTATPL